MAPSRGSTTDDHRIGDDDPEHTVLRIECPHCGMRDYTEYAYGGDASRPRPHTTREVHDDEWDAYMYLRSNPRGRHVEYWHHTLGCRCWLKVTRDSVTDAITDVRFAQTQPGRDAGQRDR